MDLFNATGHVMGLPDSPDAMPPQLLRQREDGRFVDVSAAVGEGYFTGVWLGQHGRKNRRGPARLRGRGQALYAVIAYGFPGVLGGLLGGVISDRWGLASVFWASVLTSLLAAAATYKVWRHHHPLSHTA